MRRTKEEMEQTRKDLILAGLKVFNRCGYSSAKLEDVAKEAGVSRGAIYYHFKNKSDIFKQIVLENKEQSIDKFLSAIREGKGNILETLSNSIEEFCNKIETCELYRQAEELIYKTELVKDLSDIEKLFKDHSKKAFNAIAEALENGKEKGTVNKNLDTKAFTFSLMGYYYGLMSMWLLNRDIISIKEKANEFSKIILHSARP